MSQLRREGVALKTVKIEIVRLRKKTYFKYNRLLFDRLGLFDRYDAGELRAIRGKKPYMHFRTGWYGKAEWCYHGGKVHGRNNDGYHSSISARLFKPGDTIELDFPVLIGHRVNFVGLVRDWYVNHYAWRVFPRQPKSYKPREFFATLYKGTRQAIPLVRGKNVLEA